MPLTRAARGAALLVALVLVVSLPGCQKSKPAMKSRSFSPFTDSLRKVAVVRFDARASTESGLSGGVRQEDAALVSRLVGEALYSRGIAVVSAVDVERAREAEGLGDERLDPRGAAHLAAKQFGATAVMVGEVIRFRELDKDASSARGASVSFRMSLFDAPSARKLWSARFDETQKPLSSNILDRPEFPGGGTRWLSATELARWGAQTSIDTLPTN